MNCSKIQNLLSAYMDGELTGEEQLHIRRHLSECTACAEEHESLQTTKRMISSLSIRQSHPDLEQMILQALAEEDAGRGGRSAIPTFLSWWQTLPINRRLQFVSAVTFGALALAAVRIAPIVLAPQKHAGTPINGSYMEANSVQPAQRPSPSGMIQYLFNPAENAPMTSGGTHAVPVSMETAGPELH